MAPPATAQVFPQATLEYLGMAGIGLLAVVGYVVKWVREKAESKDKPLPPTALTTLSSDPNQMRLALESLSRIEMLTEHTAKGVDDIGEEQERVARAFARSEAADKRNEDAYDRLVGLIRSLDDAVRSRPKG